ncbi:HAD-IB family hydrolase [Vibrio sp. L5-1]|uniref:HAD family hydrolase n=1 Tax=Vibrio TaxID=662 RepID=UPI00148B558A|nr:MULTISPECIES: HAD family hydrolase [Vibrio]MCF7494385.1 HAD-IB family hydrolase [Vibrio sp. L5-1]NOJ03141.1 HAD family hydrolase [Vibrio splendidus]
MFKPLYVFDMDETLINADAAMLWNAFLVEKGIATAPNFIEEDKRLMGLYSEGKLNMEDYLTFSMQPLADMPTEQVTALVEECVEQHILPKQFKQSKPLIEQLDRDNIDMLIISASVTFLVEAVGRKVGIENALGIDLVESQGRFTSEILGVPSYREGKVTRLKEWLDNQETNYSNIHFYTDSINDLPLCEYADFAYLVNPCPRLKAIADQPNWSILDWD